MEILIQQISPENKLVKLDELDVFSNQEFPLKPFDGLIIDFFNSISKEILKNINLNRIPAITALGFWLRKANFQNIQTANNHLFNNKNFNSAPLGIAFHVCPSNVDTMFLYSLSLSLLMGNKNILRVSQRMDHPNIKTIFDIINKLIAEEKFNIFKNYLNLISYGHNAEINQYLSQNSDVRVIWGGDETINLFKSFKTHPKTQDIVFSDRISYSIFKSSAFNNIDDVEKKELARKFFNDSYTFDQKGCSSPQTIFILGQDDENLIFEKQFYFLLNEVSNANYENDISSLASLKFNQLTEDIIENKIGSFISENNITVFATIAENSVTGHTCGGGYFYLKQLNAAVEILPFIDKKTQTLSYFGLTENEIKSLMEITSGKGIDRIVPIGKALDFGYIWDGYNLLDELSRKVYYQ